MNTETQHCQLFHDPYITLAVDCGPLANPPKGRVSVSGTTVGSTATYSCEGGYLLVGERTRECLATGEWSGKEPVCTGKRTKGAVMNKLFFSLFPLVYILPIVIDCGTLSAPPNGAVDFSAGTVFGDKATYSCNSGYILKGPATRECQIDGEWSGEDPVCKRKKRVCLCIIFE